MTSPVRAPVPYLHEVLSRLTSRRRLKIPENGRAGEDGREAAVTGGGAQCADMDIELAREDGPLLGSNLRGEREANVRSEHGYKNIYNRKSGGVPAAVSN